MKDKLNKASDNDLMNFSDIADSLYDYIKLTWNANVSPKGYKKFLESYDETNDWDVNHEKMIKDFKGLNDTTASTPSFPLKLEINNVAYDDKEQGRNPLRVLIGAILCHGMEIGEERAKRELKNKFSDRVKFLKIAMKNMEDFVK